MCVNEAWFTQKETFYEAARRRFGEFWGVGVHLLVRNHDRLDDLRGSPRYSEGIFALEVHGSTGTRHTFSDCNHVNEFLKSKCYIDAW